MIDIDTESSQRDTIIQKVTEKFGEDRVLSIGTRTTQAIRSTIIDVCVSLGYEREIGQLIANSFPTDNGEEWELKDALFGNPKKSKKPNAKFINSLKEHLNIQTPERFAMVTKSLVEVNSLVSGRSAHASGVIIYPDNYINYNAMMKTSGGNRITQYDAYDSEYCGGMKMDFLTVTALDRIRTAFNLLLKNNLIQWKGSLRETYEFYFHPDKIDTKSKHVFDTIYQGHVFDLFQFSTLLGEATIKKLNARTFEELCAANSLMRLTISNGEQPLDKFIRFRDNPNEWEKEMDMYELTTDEKEILHSYLDKCCGVCSTQEDIMRLIHDPRIGNYSMADANKFRKLIAKQDTKLLSLEFEKYMDSGKKTGNSWTLLRYVWEMCFVPAFGLVA